MSLSKVGQQSGRFGDGDVTSDAANDIYRCPGKARDAYGMPHICTFVPSTTETLAELTKALRLLRA